MLKWLITLGLLSIVAWRWWTNYRVFLNRFRNNKAARTLGGQTPPQPASKIMVRTCHHCGTLMPPDLGVQRGDFFFCKEHAPTATPEPRGAAAKPHSPHDVF